MPVAVPVGPHDPARKIQFDMVDAVQNLLSDATDKALGSVVLLREGPSKTVACGRREEVARSEDSRPQVFARRERLPPRDVDPVLNTRATDARDPALRESLHSV